MNGNIERHDRFVWLRSWAKDIWDGQAFGGELDNWLSWVKGYEENGSLPDDLRHEALLLRAMQRIVPNYERTTP